MLIPLWPRKSSSIPNQQDTHDGGYNQHNGWKKRHHEEVKKLEKSVSDETIKETVTEASSNAPVIKIYEEDAFKNAQDNISNLYSQLSELSKGLEDIALRQAYLKQFEENIRIFLEHEAQLRAEEEEILLMLLLN